MGSSTSKSDKTEALKLCKQRKTLIKQAIDSRYALAASHVSYTHSLRSVGVALRRFAEAEVLIDSSLSATTAATSSAAAAATATELENNTTISTPSHSPSPSSHLVTDSPLLNDDGTPSPLASRLSYMKSNGPTSVTVNFDPKITDARVVADDDSMAFPLPPPPPLPEMADVGGGDGGGSSWDYFDPSDGTDDNFRFVGQSGEEEVNFGDLAMWSKKYRADNGAAANQGKMRRFGATGPDSVREKFTDSATNGEATREEVVEGEQKNGSEPSSALVRRGLTKGTSNNSNKLVVEKEELCGEREDPSEYITHRAKDFLLSIKDIEHRFFRASEAGKEVSRMLEASKIRVGYAEATGNPSDSALSVFGLACCSGKSVHSASSCESPHHVNKIITWKRSTSSMSSSSRNPLAGGSKDDGDDSGSDFVEEFSMIAGSHSSSLERLYAWERKLYDEVKASEIIRVDYDRICNQLKHQFAKDVRTQVIDKTRATAKNLHSQMKVALHSVDLIAKRIEKMRDEELHPQLVEMVQGFIRMWKAMLECHHAQYITISLAYHAKSFTQMSNVEAKQQILIQLLHEVECFGLSFANWMSSHTSYIEALNGWLQSCIMQPRDRSSKNRRPLSPRRVLAPPIFVLCRDWAVGIRALPSDEVSGAIKLLLSDLLRLVKQQGGEEDQQKSHNSNQGELEENGESNEEANAVMKSSNLHCLHSSLTRVLDRLTKFSEAALKLFEDVKQRNEQARVAYLNGRPSRLYEL